MPVGWVAATLLKEYAINTCKSCAERLVLHQSGLLALAQLVVGCWAHCRERVEMCQAS